MEARSIIPVRYQFLLEPIRILALPKDAHQLIGGQVEPLFDFKGRNVAGHRTELMLVLTRSVIIQVHELAATFAQILDKLAAQVRNGGVGRKMLRLCRPQPVKLAGEDGLQQLLFGPGYDAVSKSPTGRPRTRSRSGPLTVATVPDPGPGLWLLGCERTWFANGKAIFGVVLGFVPQPAAVETLARPLRNIAAARDQIIGKFGSRHEAMQIFVDTIPSGG